MAPQQIHSRDSPNPGSGNDVEPGSVSHSYGDGKFAAVTLTGHPVDKSKTGGTRATKYVYALMAADSLTSVSVTINLVFYLYAYFYQNFSSGAVISNNYTGTFFIVPVLGSFLADSYLGQYYTTVAGGVVQLLGLALLVLSSNVSSLRPPVCTPTLTATCPPAASKYMAPVYAGIYTLAVGCGLVKSSGPAFGADQFDDFDPVEKQQSVHYFLWFYFFQNAGLVLAPTLSVYILEYKSRSWGFAWILIFFAVAFTIFLAGTPKYRHKRVGGSFLTRIAQVSVAAIRKRKLALPEDASCLYDAPISGGWLNRSNKLRFLDKASIIDNATGNTSNRWRLVGVTQVEEAKRIFRLLPVWAPTCFVSVIFAQVFTFTATQGATLDRRLGSKHFVIPPATVGGATIFIVLLAVPIYDKLLLPILKKISKNPYGVSPLKRVGTSIVTAIFAMITAALVERKRLHYIRELGYTQQPVFVLPMSMWWLVPQYFFSSITELFLVVSLLEFFYHEVSDATRSMGTAFLYAALSLGYFLSSVLVNVTNHITRHQKGGAWLIERLNNGGLENYYWLLAVCLSVNFLFFLLTTYFYEYNYSMFRSGKKNSDDSTTLSTSSLDKELQHSGPGT